VKKTQRLVLQRAQSSAVGPLAWAGMLVLAVLLAGPLACAGGADDSTDRYQPGWVRNAEFGVDEDGQIGEWVFSHHANHGSYRWTSAQGVLAVERIGPEPWGKAFQMHEVSQWVGRTVEFSAELSGELRTGEQPVITPSGISLQIHGLPSGGHRLLGQTVLQVVEGQPELPGGAFDFQPQRLQVTIPDGARELEIIVQLGHYGILRARRLSLTPIDD